MFSMEHIEIAFSGRLLVHNTELDDQLTVQQGKRLTYTWVVASILRVELSNFPKEVDWQKGEQRHDDLTRCLNL